MHLSMKNWQLLSNNLLLSEVTEVVTMETRAVCHFFSSSKARAFGSTEFLSKLRVLPGLGGAFGQVDGPGFVAGALRWGWDPRICLRVSALLFAVIWFGALLIPQNPKSQFLAKLTSGW